MIVFYFSKILLVFCNTYIPYCAYNVFLNSYCEKKIYLIFYYSFIFSIIALYYINKISQNLYSGSAAVSVAATPVTKSKKKN